MREDCNNKTRIETDIFSLKEKAKTTLKDK